MGEQILLVVEQKVQAAVQRVVLRGARVHPKQISQRCS
jgi:hypothetical protein